MVTSAWVKLPTVWIKEGGLESFRWIGSEGPAGVAALMVLTVLAHNADKDSGIATITYDQIAEAVGLSRSKISAGLRKLESLGIVAMGDKRSEYRLCGFAYNGWGKLPASSLYARNVIRPFADFTLRKKAELDALKLYFLFVERRDEVTNLAHISYDKISRLSGISRNAIKTAQSLLISANMIYVEHIPLEDSEYGVANSYRLIGINPRVHLGTRLRSDPELLLREKTVGDM